MVPHTEGGPTLTTLPSSPGTYILIFRCRCADCITIRRLGDLQFQPGFYVYVGSAFCPGGLRARIARHERVLEHPRWHMDYLCGRAEVNAVFYRRGVQREHTWARGVSTLPGAVVALKGFGTSGCRCVAHLFWFEDDHFVMQLLKAMGPHAKAISLGASPE